MRSAHATDCACHPRDTQNVPKSPSSNRKVMILLLVTAQPPPYVFRPYVFREGGRVESHWAVRMCGLCTRDGSDCESPRSQGIGGHPGMRIESNRFITLSALLPTKPPSLCLSMSLKLTGRVPAVVESRRTARSSIPPQPVLDGSLAALNAVLNALGSADRVTNSVNCDCIVFRPRMGAAEPTAHGRCRDGGACDGPRDGSGG